MSQTTNYDNLRTDSFVLIGMHVSCRPGLRAVKAGRVLLVDGDQMFNRPSARLVNALEWLVGVLHDHPDLIPSDFPWVRSCSHD